MLWASYLGQNLPHYDVCLFRAQYRASGASRDSHCASHSCEVKRNGHSPWSNVVKKVIFKNLSAFLGASGRQSFRNMAIAGCAHTAWKWQPKRRLSHHSYFYTFPLSEIYSYRWRGIGVGWVCETLCCWQLYTWDKLLLFLLFLNLPAQAPFWLA